MERRSEALPGLSSINIAGEAPCTGLGGGPAAKEPCSTRLFDASDETISKSAASTETRDFVSTASTAPSIVTGRRTVYFSLPCRRSLPSTSVYRVDSRQFSPQTAHAHPQPFCTRVPFSVSVFTAAVWCVPALRVPLVHSLINHFRQSYLCGRCRQIGTCFVRGEFRVLIHGRVRELDGKYAAHARSQPRQLTLPRSPQGTPAR